MDITNLRARSRALGDGGTRGLAVPAGIVLPWADPGMAAAG